MRIFVKTNEDAKVSPSLFAEEILYLYVVDPEVPNMLDVIFVGKLMEFKLHVSILLLNVVDETTLFFAKFLVTSPGLFFLFLSNALETG